MTPLRRMLGPIAATWLLCHVIGVTTAPIVFSITGLAESLECTCAHGEHAICPMHHRPAADTRCALRAPAGGDTALLSSALSGIGILPAPTALVVATASTVRTAVDLSPVSLRPTPPDPPPPRA